MDRKSGHSYEHEQLVEVTIEEGHPPVIGRVLAVFPEKCSAHNSPMYGCECGGMHVTTCEAIMQPLTKEQKRKLN